jgi:hypothetical protein
MEPVRRHISLTDLQCSLIYSHIYVTYLHSDVGIGFKCLTQVLVQVFLHVCTRGTFWKVSRNTDTNIDVGRFQMPYTSTSILTLM